MLDNNPWPSEPSRRKVILVLKPDDFVDLQYNAGEADIMINKEIYVMPLPSSPASSEVQKIGQSLVTAGAVLIQDPFDKDRYYNISDAIQNIAIAKLLHFSTLCTYLGVRKVEVEQSVLDDTKQHVEKGINFEAGGKGSANVSGIASVNVGQKVGANVDFESGYLKSYASKMFSNYECTGSDPNIPMATDFLEQKGLSTDPIMRDILNKIEASVKMSNRITRYGFDLELMTEVHQYIKILGGLSYESKQRFNIPESLSIGNEYEISLEAEYYKKNTTNNRYILRLLLQF